MTQPGRSLVRKMGWILGGILAGLAILGVLGAVFLPIFVVKWLGGEKFREIASQQLSGVLQTEGEFKNMEWSSFSVYSQGFASRPDAPGAWLWNLQEIRTEISPRLLLDRILRFSEISVDRLTLSPGTRPRVPVALPGEASAHKESPDLFREVQIGKVIVRSFGLNPSPASLGWGVRDLQVILRPTRQATEFELKGGSVITPLSWVGTLQLESAKGRYADPTVFVTNLDAKGLPSGVLQVSGETTLGSAPKARGRIRWEHWPVPGGKVGVGLFEIPAQTSGDFVLQEIQEGGVTGQGQIRLTDARLEPGKGSETILSLLATLTGEARLRGCPLNTARAEWSMRPGIVEVTRIEAEASGLLRATGQAKVVGQGVSGQILLGLEEGLGSKVNALTGGECFQRTENGFRYEPVNLSGTLDQPKNDLQAKLTSAMARTAVRTGAQILENAAGSQGGDAAKAAGQILNSLFGPPGR